MNMADEFDRYFDKMNTLNMNSAKAQMDFQEKMSSSAHQREVKDLIAAGLNPVLSANNGASSPMGAYANVDNSAISAKFARQNLERDLANQRTIAAMNNENAMRIAQAQIASNYALGIYQSDNAKEASMYNSDMQKIIKEMDINNPDTLSEFLIRLGQGGFGSAADTSDGVKSIGSKIVDFFRNQFVNSNSRDVSKALSLKDQYKSYLENRSYKNFTNYYKQVDRVAQSANKQYRFALKNGLSKSQARDIAAKVWNSNGMKPPKKYSYQ